MLFIKKKIPGYRVPNCGYKLKYTCLMSLPDAPNVTIQQCSTPVIEGENATLQCSATGNPVPSTAWIRKSTGEVVSYNETLIFPNIKRNESSGNYECLAWNGIGNNSTKFCTFDVHCKLAFIFKVVVSCTSIQYRPKGSYHRLARRVSFLSRRVSLLSRRVSFLSRRVLFLSRRVSFLSRRVSFLSSAL